MQGYLAHKNLLPWIQGHLAHKKHPQVPVSRGGGFTWDNVVACCLASNHRKGNRLLEVSAPSQKPKLSSEYGTCEMVLARFWPWLSVTSPETLLRCSLLARKRQGEWVDMFRVTGEDETYPENR